MENRELTYEERAMIYTIRNDRLALNEILSRPEVIDEIRKAYIAGCNDTRKIQFIPVEEMAERYALEHSCMGDGCRLVMAAFKAGYEKK